MKQVANESTSVVIYKKSIKTGIGTHPLILCTSHFKSFKEYVIVVL